MALTGDDTGQYWNDFSDLYEDSIHFVSFVQEVEDAREWKECVIQAKQAASELSLIAERIRSLSEAGVDPAVIAYGHKSASSMDKTSKIFDLLVLFYTYDSEHSSLFTPGSSTARRMLEVVTGGISKFRKASELDTKRDQVKAKLKIMIEENGVERSVLNAERDYLQRLLFEKYGMKFEEEL